jgi:hypothetical protein
MSQTSMSRCVLSAAMMSVVVGGLAYGTAKQQCENQQEKFRVMAQEECLANDPSKLMNLPDNATVQDEIDSVRKLRSLHDLCAFGLTVERHS